MEDDDDDAADDFAMIMESRDAGSGTVALHNSLADQVTSTARPLLPTARGARNSSVARGGGVRAATRDDDDDDDDDDTDDDDDDADLIYRRNQRREASRKGARSMAL